MRVYWVFARAGLMTTYEQIYGQTYIQNTQKYVCMHIWVWEYMCVCWRERERERDREREYVRVLRQSSSILWTNIDKKWQYVRMYVCVRACGFQFMCVCACASMNESVSSCVWGVQVCDVSVYVRVHGCMCVCKRFSVSVSVCDLCVCVWCVCVCVSV
jgi:hypothetical protein